MLHDALVALAFPFIFLLVGVAQWCIIDFLYRRDEPWPPNATLRGYVEPSRVWVNTGRPMTQGHYPAAGSLYNEPVAVIRRVFVPTGQGDYAHNIPVQVSQAAHGKALDLLREWLTPVQLADFKANYYFFVYGNATGTRYRIRMADSYFNVDEMNIDNSVKQRLCFVCQDQVAPGDTMLAQKVMLEQNELHALQIANTSMPPGTPRLPESHYEHFYG